MIKTLFNYESDLTSLDLNLIVSTLLGVGVVNGFDNGTINGNKLILTSDSINPVSQPATDISIEPLERISHACVSRNGSLYVNDQDTLEVSPIGGSKSKHNEVLLFANHQYIPDSVVNPVNLTAYWNPLQISFYEELYKKYTTGDISLEHATRLSNNSLDELLSKLSFYNKNSMVFLGVYGTYVDKVTGEQIKVSTPIYGNKFPTVVSKQDAIIPILNKLLVHQTTYETNVIKLTNQVSGLGVSNENLSKRLDDAIRRIGVLEASGSETTNNLGKQLKDLAASNEDLSKRLDEAIVRIKKLEDKGSETPESGTTTS